MIRLMTFLIGFGISIIGFIYIITYLNYLTIGYTWHEYFNLISTKIECLLAPIGIIILCISIFRKRKDNDLCV